VRQLTRLDAVCKIVMGQAPDGSAYNEAGEGLPLIAGAGDFGGIHPLAKKFTSQITRTSEVGDIILGIRATIGEKVLADAEYCLGRGVSGLRPGPKLDVRFLWHWLTHIQPELSRKAKGATFKQVNKNDIGELEIELPSVAEQRRIAAILDKADALGAKKREVVSRVDELVQSMFIDMFGDPVGNPMGWPDASLGDLIESASDGPHISPQYVESGVPLLSTRHVRPGRISWQDLKYLSAEDAETQWKKCKPRRGDILYSKGGTTGFAAAVRTDDEFAVWVHIALLRLNTKSVDTDWLEAMLNSNFCYRQSQELTHGIANRDLGLKRMTQIRMYRPPIALQREFSARVEKLRTLRSMHANSLRELDSLFLSLQHRAFNGTL
jgi:type I restriction enzyme, S subunit